MALNGECGVEVEEKNVSGESSSCFLLQTWWNSTLYTVIIHVHTHTHDGIDSRLRLSLEAGTRQLALKLRDKSATDLRSCLFIPPMWRIACCSLSGCRLPGKARPPERAGGPEEVLADPVGGGVLSQPQHRPQGPEGGEPVTGRTHEHQDRRYCSNTKGGLCFSLKHLKTPQTPYPDHLHCGG